VTKFAWAQSPTRRELPIVRAWRIRSPMTTGPCTTARHCVKWQPIRCNQNQNQTPLRVREGAVAPHSANDSESHTPRLASLPLKRSRGKKLHIAIAGHQYVATISHPKSVRSQRRRRPPSRPRPWLSHIPRSESNRSARTTVCLMFRPDVSSNKTKR
jgi:hypothetical protein